MPNRQKLDFSNSLTDLAGQLNSHAVAEILGGAGARASGVDGIVDDSCGLRLRGVGV